jgi:hypothetical protein
MKIEKLLHKLQAFFDTDKRKKKQHIEELKKILLKLKKKERKALSNRIGNYQGATKKRH